MKKGCQKASFSYNFHHANFMPILMIIKGNLKIFHSEITTSPLLSLLRHSLALGNSDQRVV